MNKFTRVIAVLATALQISAFADYNDSSSQMSDDPFTGFDISLGIGVSSLTVEQKLIDAAQNDTEWFGGDGVAVQGRVGANYQMDCFVFGLGVYGQYNSAQTYSYRVTTSPESIVKSTFEMPGNIAIDAKIGLCPTENTLVYLYGGPDWGYYDYYYLRDALVTRYSDFEIGGVFGFGLQHMFNECWTIKVNADYRWFSTKQLTHPSDEVLRITPRLTTGLINLGYCF